MTSFPLAAMGKTPDRTEKPVLAAVLHSIDVCPRVLTLILDELLAASVRSVATGADR